MRRIFVALQGGDDGAALLRLAGHLASVFDAQIEAAFINDVAAAGERDAAVDRSGLAAARAAFAAFASAGTGVMAPVRAAWREIEDGPVYASASLGRASDLILTRSAGRLADEDGVLPGDRGRRGFRDALLASGRLTLLAPAGAVDGTALFDQVVVAWDGSAGAAHALAQSIPFLARAKSVRVVIVGRNTLGEGAREAISSYAGLHHAGAGLLVCDNAHRQTGRVLLDALRAERASLVVMGVYGRSHATGGGAPAASLGGTILKVIEDGRIPILTAI